MFILSTFQVRPLSVVVNGVASALSTLSVFLNAMSAAASRIVVFVYPIRVNELNEEMSCTREPYDVH